MQKLRFLTTGKIVFGGALVAMMLMTACSEKKTDTNIPIAEANFDSIYSVVISTQCERCHRSDGENGGLYWLTGSKVDAYSMLIGSGANSGVVSAPGLSNCAGVGLRYIQPGVPSSSYLLALVSTEYNDVPDFGGKTGCVGEDLHLGYIASQQQANAIKTWIEQGASQ